MEVSLSGTRQAFHSISEVAKELDLPTHVLRFWETKFKEIEPVKRAGGRRYYRTEDVELISHIKELLYKQGYTIKGVQALLKQEKKQKNVVNSDVEQIDISSASIEAVITPSFDIFGYKENLSHLLEELKTIRAVLNKSLYA